MAVGRTVRRPEFHAGQTQAVVDAAGVGVDDPAGKARQTGFDTEAGGQLLPVEPRPPTARAGEFLGSPGAASSHGFPGYVTWRVGRLVVAQAGEVVASAALRAGARTAVVAQGYGRCIGFRSGVDEAALVGLEKAPGADQTEWMAGFEGQARQCQPTAGCGRNGDFLRRGAFG